MCGKQTPQTNPASWIVPKTEGILGASYRAPEGSECSHKEPTVILIVSIERHLMLDASKLNPYIQAMERQEYMRVMVTIMG